MTRPPRALLAACALALTPVVTAGQEQVSGGLLLLQQWLTTVEEHRPGSLDAPLIAAAAWSGAEMDQLWIDTQALMQGALSPRKYRFSVRPQAAGAAARMQRTVPRSIEKEDREAFDALAERVLTRGINAVLHRAAILHTDVVVEAPDLASSAGSDSSRVGRRWSVGDGTGQGTFGLSLHLEAARMLLESVTPDPRRDTFVRDWYRAVVAREQAAEYFDSRQMNLGLRLFPDDPELLLLAGAEREAMSSPMFQAFARTLVFPRGLTGIQSDERELSLAAGFYQRALAAQPRFPEARLRLGRVLGRQGKYADSARELQIALDTDLDTTHAYYAWTFLGVAREGLGETDTALDAYRRAAALAAAPRAPLLAMARLARELGDRPLVTESLAAALVPTTLDDPIDPLWLYRAAPGRRRMPLLDDVRRRAGEDRP